MGKGEIVRNSLYGKLEKTLSYNEGNIQIDDPEAGLVHDRDFCPVVTELVNNCLNAGADNVIVTVNWGCIIVEDDVEHTPEELGKILDNVRSEKPRTTKDPDPEFGIPFGGVGIRSVRIDLNKHDGSLDYEATQNGRIRAIASWSTSEK